MLGSFCYNLSHKKPHFLGLIICLLSMHMINPLNAQGYQIPNVQGGKSRKKILLYEGNIKLTKCAPVTKYYRFEKGDKVHLSFKKKKGNKIESFRIFSYPNNELYSQNEITDNFQQVFEVPKRGVYGIELIGGSCISRKKLVRLKIERTPLDDSTNFNTEVVFKTQWDTSYYTVLEPVLIRTDSAIIQLTDENVKISSHNALNGNRNRAVVSIELPSNLVNCSFYIGVGQNGSAAYDKTISDQLTATALSMVNPWYALMVYGLNRFLSVNAGDNVRFWVTNFPLAAQNFMSNGAVPNDIFLISYGDVLNATKSFTKPKSGKISFLLLNDNIIDPIYVRIVVSALTAKEVFENQEINKVKITSREIPIE